jgi:hypothetical protein
MLKNAIAPCLSASMPLVWRLVRPAHDTVLSVIAPNVPRYCAFHESSNFFMFCKFSLTALIDLHFCVVLETLIPLMLSCNSGFNTSSREPRLGCGHVVITKFVSASIPEDRNVRSSSLQDLGELLGLFSRHNCVLQCEVFGPVL